MPVAAPAPAPLLPVSTPRVAAPVLVDAVWLTAHLHDVVVVDTRRTSEFLDGHLPGAASFPLDALLVEDTSPEALQRLARAAQEALAIRGIGPGDHVVLVDDADGSAALGAAICELAGLTRVSTLHGGVRSWANLGRAWNRQPSMRAPLDPAEMLALEPVLTHVASIDDVVQASFTRSAVLVDARAQLEHEGIVGAPCCAVRGAIPGSIHLEWTSLIDMAGEPHLPERVRAIVDHIGVPADAPIIVFCHAGHRAAVAARVLRAAGYADVRMSIGSWHEWAGRGLPTAHDSTA